MVLLEAQACARAVIAGDSGGTAEAVCAGETGVVTDCSRSEPLAAAVATLARRRRAARAHGRGRTALGGASISISTAGCRAPPSVLARVPAR